MVKRQELTREMVDRAIDIYSALAYGGEPKKRSADKNAASAKGSAKAHSAKEGAAKEGAAKDGKEGAAKERDAGDVTRGFVEETRCENAGQPCLERYTMRLGNRSYPFMKLVIQEHMIPGEFYFAVDTHDQMEIRPDFPDYEAWMKIRRFNFALKRRIEEALSENGLPTLRSIRDNAVLAPARSRGSQDRPLIFVVDDEADEAQMLEAVLRRDGYDVVLAFDGREALERMPFLDPALMILDYEMPEIDGLTVIEELRRDERTRQLPILLTTASRVLGKEGSCADGFLPKPFASNDLLSLVHRLLAKS